MSEWALEDKGCSLTGRLRGWAARYESLRKFSKIWRLLTSFISCEYLSRHVAVSGAPQMSRAMRNSWHSRWENSLTAPEKLFDYKISIGTLSASNRPKKANKYSTNGSLPLVTLYKCLVHCPRNLSLHHLHVRRWRGRARNWQFHPWPGIQVQPAVCARNIWRRVGWLLLAILNFGF